MENLSNCISISQIRFKILPISEWTFKRLRITFKILQIFAKSGHTVSYLMFPFCLLALHSFTFIWRLSSLSLSVSFFLSLLVHKYHSLALSQSYTLTKFTHSLLPPYLFLTLVYASLSLSFSLALFTSISLFLPPSYTLTKFTHTLSLSLSPFSLCILISFLFPVKDFRQINFWLFFPTWNLVKINRSSSSIRKQQWKAAELTKNGHG